MGRGGRRRKRGCSTIPGLFGPGRAGSGLTSMVDTNVVVSGTIGADPASPPARILDPMLDGRLIHLMSGSLFAEYSEVLRRPAVARLHRLSDDEVDRLLTVIAANPMWRQATTASPAPDAGDNHPWALLAIWPESDRTGCRETPRSLCPEGAWVTCIETRQVGGRGVPGGRTQSCADVRLEVGI